MNPKFKIAWTVALVLLSLILATTAVYALYRYFSDPGLQAVSDAGLIQVVNMTAQPTLQLNLENAPGTPQPTLSESVIKNDLTATLVSAYADSQRLAFTVHFDGWKDGYELGVPMLQDANGANLDGQANFSPSDSDPATWTISMEPPNGLQLDRFEGKLSLHVILAESQSPPFVSFEFDIDVPVYKPIVLEPKQSVTAHGVKMRLDKIEMTPSYTKFYLSVNSHGNLSGAWNPTWPEIKLNQDNEPTMALEIPTFQFGTKEDSNVISFPIGYENHPKTLTMIINAFTPGIGNPAEAVTSADLKAAQQKLKAQGMEISYTESDWKNEGFTVQKKPNNMSDMQVRLLFEEAVGIYYPGPWVFTIDIP